MFLPNPRPLHHATSLPRLNLSSASPGPRTASPRQDKPRAVTRLDLEQGLDSIFRATTPNPGLSSRSPVKPRMVKSYSRASIFDDDQGSSNMEDIEVYHTISGGRRNPIAASRQPQPFSKITRRPAAQVVRLGAMGRGVTPVGGRSLVRSVGGTLACCPSLLTYSTARACGAS